MTNSLPSLPPPLRRAFYLFLFILTCIWVPGARADLEWRHALEARAFARSDTQLELQWKPAQRATLTNPGRYFVSRRNVGDTIWTVETEVTEKLGSNYIYRDTVQPGSVHEYRISSEHSEGNGYAYLQAGVKVPFSHSRGTALLIVEKGIMDDPAFETPIQVFISDLVGDGWRVLAKTDVPCGVDAQEEEANAQLVQQWIRSLQSQNPKAVILLGPVPYKKVTVTNHADFHTEARSIGADAFYGDMNGDWSGNLGGMLPVDGGGSTRTVELQVGRIDMRKLDIFAASEKQLLLDYLQKNHSYRQAAVVAAGALWADTIGYKDGGENPGANGIRLFGPTVGIAETDVVRVNTGTLSFDESWLGRVSAAGRSPYVWVCGSGAGAYRPQNKDTPSPWGHGILGMRERVPTPTGSEPQFAFSQDLAQRGANGIFFLTFGSYGADFHQQNSLLRTILAAGPGLAAAWAGRPFLHLHGMGIGETIGECFRRSQNVASTSNYDTSTAGQHLQKVHMSLMGDPTLRLHPVPPARSVTKSSTGTGMSVTWQPPVSTAGLVGYHVYRGSSLNGPFVPLTSAPLAATETSYPDRTGTGAETYMVRAIFLQDGPSGSYYNGAQGEYSGSGQQPASVATPVMSVPSDTYTQAQSVTITTATADASIRYTLDGTNPTSTTGTLYQNAVLIDSTKTLKAIAFKSGMADSGIATASYIINAGSGAENKWFDVALPSGAGGISSTSAPGTWVTGPSPDSRMVHISPDNNNEHSHWFGWSNANLAIGTNDKLYAWVYIDPANVPEEIMISWSTASSWEHRAYWGTSKLPWGAEGTSSLKRIGDIPAPGQWVRLEVDASAVGMANQVATAMKFTTFNGRVYWDSTGKIAAAANTVSAPTFSPAGGTYSQAQSVTLASAPGASIRYTLNGTDPTPTSGTEYTIGQSIQVTATTTIRAIAYQSGMANSAVSSATYTITVADETAWFNYTPPQGAGGISSTSAAGTWVTGSSPDSRTVHISPDNNNEHSHWFGWSNANLSIGANDKLYAWVYIDPANVPEEIMISWSTASSWEHRAYWGTSKLPWGAEGTAALKRVGDIPAPGQWVRLEVDASAVGMANQVATGMKFTTFNGRVYWDATGKISPAANAVAAPTFSPGGGTYSQPQSVSLTSSPGASIRYTLDGTEPSPTSGFAYTGQSIQVTSTTTIKAIGYQSGMASSTISSAIFTISVANETAWFDNTPPQGAGGVSSTSVANDWVYGNSPATAGVPARAVHISPDNNNEHSHWFGWSNANLSIGANDKLYTWVYIDPANVPEEIMISWSTASSWEHRAYWGTSKLPWGAEGTAALKRVGDIPPPGQWVRLEVDASAVGMANQVATGMKFTTFNGRVYWDATGKQTQ